MGVGQAQATAACRLCRAAGRTRENRGGTSLYSCSLKLLLGNNCTSVVGAEAVLQAPSQAAASFAGSGSGSLRLRRYGDWPGVVVLIRHMVCI